MLNSFLVKFKFHEFKYEWHLNFKIESDGDGWWVALFSGADSFFLVGVSLFAEIFYSVVNADL